MKDKRVKRLNSLLREVISEVLQKDVKNPNISKFTTITEVDITSDRKYKYVGTRIELHEPIIVKRDQAIISYRYKNIITSYNNYIR